MNIFYGTILSEEFGAPEHSTRSQQVYAALVSIERLQFMLADADPIKAARIRVQIAALEASIADYGF